MSKLGPKPRYDIMIRAKVYVPAKDRYEHIASVQFTVDSGRISFAKVVERIALLFAPRVPKSLRIRLAKAQDKIDSLDPRLKVWEKLKQMTGERLTLSQQSKKMREEE